jgi:hypothetical protein
MNRTLASRGGTFEDSEGVIIFKITFGHYDPIAVTAFKFDRDSRG